MRNETKTMKQNSLRSGIIIKLGLWAAVVALGLWLISQVSINILMVVSLVSTYLMICLLFKIVRFLIKVIFSLLSLIILTSLFLMFFF
ncbi:hypothetical protein JGH11_04965 [Dysgonomonas sp. Marseille-P4677]|uniref:hypothetical protein n=1 Tax=Dysgonomonas sp. Marseille-P4677 TaxID=2364790 RepID=UPI001911C7B9|nr:hypothetical protein [Dysgonomonas sp. Marseille-P4677]MBK5720217.1 hypothetical protein [Dysgonomonas sp. Marseille-P4677]